MADSYSLHDSLAEKLQDVATMQDGLELMAHMLKPYGVRYLVYGYCLSKKAIARNDVLMKMTLPEHLIKLYFAQGGPSTDFIGEKLPENPGPIDIDLLSLLASKNFESMRAQKAFIQGLIDAGVRRAVTFPFTGEEILGLGTLTLHQSEAPEVGPIVIEQLNGLNILYHMSMKKNRQMANEFDLSKKEWGALVLASEGACAADVADRWDVSTRSVENYLQGARAKLKSRTTTEAVLKAVGYGIIQNNKKF